jgi:phosphotriesterase-related protein
MARVVTVRGEVAPDQLGPTMAHEHFFLDASRFYDPSSLHDPSLGDLPMEPRFAGLARWEGHLFKDNLYFDAAKDFDLVLDEVSDFVAAVGEGACLVDLTTVGLDPQYERVVELAERTGAHVVAGAGVYVHAMHPAWVCSADVDELTEWFSREIGQGMGGTSVKPGILGEIGTSEQLEPCEERVLQAAAGAAQASGLAVNVHCNPSTLDVTTRILDVLEEAGHDLTRTYLSHLDEIWDLDYHDTVLSRGVVVGFDSFGQDGYFTSSWKSLSDQTKADTMVALIGLGYRDQLVMAQDICKKHHLQRFGGMGYSHVVRRVVPRLQEVHDLDDATIHQLLVATPRRLLTVAD